MRQYHDSSLFHLINTLYDGKALYVNLSVTRSTAGEITGVERITAQKAQEYQDAFFAEELGGSFPKAREYQDAAKPQIDIDGLEEYLETKMRALYLNGLA